MQGTNNRETNDYDKLQSLLNQDAYEECTLHAEPIAAYLEMLAVLQKSSSMAIQDDYENWKANDFHCEAGKPLFID